MHLLVLHSILETCFCSPNELKNHFAQLRFVSAYSVVGLCLQLFFVQIPEVVFNAYITQESCCSIKDSFILFFVHREIKTFKNFLKGAAKLYRKQHVHNFLITSSVRQDLSCCLMCELVTLFSLISIYLFNMWKPFQFKCARYLRKID